MIGGNAYHYTSKRPKPFELNIVDVVRNCHLYYSAILYIFFLAGLQVIARCTRYDYAKKPKEGFWGHKYR